MLGKYSLKIDNIKLYVFIIVVFVGSGLLSFKSYASSNSVRLYVDCNGGTCHIANSFDLIRGEDSAVVGSTVSSVYNFDEDPTAIDQDFVGWYAYNKTTGAQLGGGLLSTSQVNNYIIPAHDIQFVAQWTPRAGYPVTNISYFVFWDGQSDPCYDVKVSITYNDTRYSGYGFVSIPQSVYSAWSGNITYTLEPLNGTYIRYDGKWCNEICEYEGSVKSFIKEKSCYLTANTTGSGSDHLTPRRAVHDWYYQASFVSPEITLVSQTTADNVISDPTVVPVTYTVSTEVYQSGSTYDKALNAAQTTYGTNNVVVVDITLKDDKGVNVTQLTDYVDVKVDLPSTYVIQPENTVIVYYMNENGILEECETIYNEDDPNNRYVNFKNNHFSIYVLVEKNVEPEPIPTVEPEDINTNENIDQAGQSERSEELSNDSIENTDNITSEVEEKEVFTDVIEINEIDNTNNGHGMKWIYYVIAMLSISAVLLALRLKK